MLNKEQKLILKNLKMQQRYLDIFNTFGINIFYRETPKKVRKKIMKYYIENNEQEKLSTLFKKKDAKRAIRKAKDLNEFKNSKNKVIGAVRYTGKRFMRNRITHITTAYFLIQLAWTGLITNLMYAANFANAYKDQIEYESEINDYNENIEAYAKYLNSLNLSDIELITKMMSDMWTNIKGYGDPNLNLTGALELDVSASDGVGVCRNMAADLAKKLNAVNPEYHARLLFVDMDSGMQKIMDIERNIVKDMDQIEESSSSYEDNDFLKKYAANHVIVALEIPGMKGTLLADITNPAFGILDDGKIKWINSEIAKDEFNIENPAIYTYKKRADYELNNKHIMNVISFLESYITSNKAQNMLIDNFDMEDQRKALEVIQAIDDHDYVRETFYSGSVDEIKAEHSNENTLDDNVKEYTR